MDMLGRALVNKVGREHFDQLMRELAHTANQWPDRLEFISVAAGDWAVRRHGRRRDRRGRQGRCVVAVAAIAAAWAAGRAWPAA